MAAWGDGSVSKHQGHQPIERAGREVVVYLCNDDDRERVLDLSVRRSSDGEIRHHEFVLGVDEERALSIERETVGAAGVSIQAESEDGIAVVDFDPEERPAPVVVVRNGTVMVVPVSA